MNKRAFAKLQIVYLKFDANLAGSVRPDGYGDVHPFLTY